MAQNSYIDDVDFWLKSIDQRNLSAYTYNEELAEQVYTFILDFAPRAKKLLEKLRDE